MRLGFVGLAEMGGNMVQRLLEDCHEIVAHDPDAQALKQAAGRGATAAKGLESLAAALQAPRLVWLMVPSGHITGQVIAELQPHLESGDAVDPINKRWEEKNRFSLTTSPAPGVLPKPIICSSVTTDAGPQSDLG